MHTCKLSWWIISIPIRVLEHNGYERLGQEEDEYVYAYKPKQLEQDTFNQDEKTNYTCGWMFLGC